MTSVIDMDVLKQVGNTSLVKLDSLSDTHIEYFAKLEGNNPFGSVKDRAAYWMIKDGEERGILKKRKEHHYRTYFWKHWNCTNWNC